jgi:predicted Zn-dependent peptidase
MYKISKLKNGMSVITAPMQGTKATTVLVLLPVGSRYENAKISGAAHFTEHMMFKGTAKRPSAMDISRELDAAGADYNAFTGKDFTGYYIRINSEQQELAFDLLSDMIFESKFEGEEIKKEKGVIVEEIRMYEDNPTMGIGMLFDKLLYGDCPLGRDEGGSIETVRGISEEELKEFYHAAYSPKNMVLVVSGKIDRRTNKFLDYFEKQNSTKAKNNISKNDFEKFTWPKEILSADLRVVAKEKKLDQAHLMLGFPGLVADDKDKYTASVLLNILGGGMSSRLFVEVREKRGLAYMIGAGAAGHRDTGSVFVRAGLDLSRLKEAIDVIKNEFAKISAKNVSDKELENAKTSLTGRMILSMEESNVRADWLSRQFWFSKKIETYEEALEKIKKVTKSDVLRVAKKIFVWEEARVAVIGQIKKENVINLMK